MISAMKDNGMIDEKVLLSILGFYSKMKFRDVERGVREKTKEMEEIEDGGIKVGIFKGDCFRGIVSEVGSIRGFEVEGMQRGFCHKYTYDSLMFLYEINRVEWEFMGGEGKRGRVTGNVVQAILFSEIYKSKNRTINLSDLDGIQTRYVI